jgi:hypothetical protein
MVGRIQGTCGKIGGSTTVVVMCYVHLLTDCCCDKILSGALKTRLTHGRLHHATPPGHGAQQLVL